jgi:hypothetical protein
VRLRICGIEHKVALFGGDVLAIQQEEANA